MIAKGEDDAVLLALCGLDAGVEPMGSLLALSRLRADRDDLPIGDSFGEAN